MTPADLLDAAQWWTPFGEWESVDDALGMSPRFALDNGHSNASEPQTEDDG